MMSDCEKAKTGRPEERSMVVRVNDFEKFKFKKVKQTKNETNTRPTDEWHKTESHLSPLLSIVGRGRSTYQLQASKVYQFQRNERERAF
jgi:hypothetical protein